MKERDEIEQIKKRYEDRKSASSVKKDSNNYYYPFFMKQERELKFLEILKTHFRKLSFRDISVMEIGAGHGDNLLFFKRLGFSWKNIYANELLEDRGAVLKEDLPLSVIHLGNALDLKYRDKFDVVFQSTVFTSILDTSFRQKLANKMLEMCKPGGIILWYDFKYDNPQNPDVKAVKKSEIIKLFSQARKISFYNVTLAPPVAKRVYKFYNLLNIAFPFLRTHVIAVIEK